MNLSRVLRRGAVVTAAAALSLVALPGTGHAISIDPVTLTGTVACDTTTGHQVVTWTLTNPSGTSVTLEVGDVDGSAMTAGEPLQSTTALSPAVVADDGTATGTTQVSGDGQGSLQLSVAYTYADLDPTVHGAVRLLGGCEQTTTTTAAPTTTSAVAATAARRVAPHFTG